MPQDELVDVVDENMNVLKTVPKVEAHRDGLLHKCVIAAVINSSGDYLMTKPVKGRQDEGQYVFPAGGHVSAGESEEEALRREVFEELGIKDFKHEFLGKVIFNRHVIGRQENHFFNLYKAYSDQEPTLGPEDESYKYFTQEELKKEIKEHPENLGDAFHFAVKRFFPELL